MTTLRTIAAYLICIVAHTVIAQSPEAELASLVDKYKEATARQDAADAKTTAPAKSAMIKELDRILVQSQSKGDLDAMSEAKAALKAAQNGEDIPTGKMLASALTQIQTNYERSCESALRLSSPMRQKLDSEYDRGIEASIQKFARAGNVEAAKAARDARRILLTVDALVDGPSTLVIRKDGCYWINGGNGKPLHTYIDGKRWGKPEKTRGDDKTAIRPLSLVSVDLQLKLISVGNERRAGGIQPRTAVESKLKGNDYHINIPDPEPGPMWYKFELRAR